MQLVLFDDADYNNLHPFTFIRPVADIRIGIMTIREKWERALNVLSTTLTRDYLTARYPFNGSAPFLLVNGALLPDDELVKTALSLQPGQQVVYNNRLIMALSNTAVSGIPVVDAKAEQVKANGNPVLVQHPWDIFTLNEQEINKDFNVLTTGRKSQALSAGNTLSGKGNIYIEEGAIVECSIINATAGPVYIAAGAEVMEGCIIRGPFSLGEKAVLKMGTRVYGATTIGPGSKVGGEISNSVIFGNSNKAHDGFLGNSVIGEWCNLGADTNNSNLKNNYGEVTVWNYKANDFIKTGLQFCGLFMGDHSKCAINTMFNTGTVVGVSANIFGAGFPDKHIPSFYWGGPQGKEMFIIDKAVELARRVYARRGLTFEKADEEILAHLYIQNLKPKDTD